MHRAWFHKQIFFEENFLQYKGFKFMDSGIYYLEVDLSETPGSSIPVVNFQFFRS